MELVFRASDYRADGGFERAEYRFDGSPERGWRVDRNGQRHLSLGPGYRLLRSQECGICSTDLGRRFLPFPLPQVTGHELVALDEGGRRHVVEINASHRARGLETDCPFCSVGLATHCPERLVLGIHGLPGGFGPWVLAPVHAAIELPDSVPSEAAVLIEPFAAALHAVRTVAPRAGDTVAVLGPRRLGLLVVAALAAHRRRSGISFEVLALSRHEGLLELARVLGATSTRLIDSAGATDELADIVIDTTGTPGGLELAIRLAVREVHLKSTHGRPAAGLRHLTELVVDELWIARLPEPPPAARSRVAWLSAGDPAGWGSVERLGASSASEFLRRIEARTHPGSLPRADLAVVDSMAQADLAIRPVEGRETALVRPRGGILLHHRSSPGSSPLELAIRERGLRLSSSRCGDFHEALALMAADPELKMLGTRLITHSFDAGDIVEAFAIAGSPDCIKVVLRHAPPGGQP